MKRDPNPDGSKECRKCGAIRPIKVFSKDRKSRDGRSNRCNPCATRVAQQRYQRLRLQAGEEYVPNLSKFDWLKILARGTFICRTCTLEKPLAAFPKRTDQVYPRRVCRDCSNSAHGRWTERRRSYVLAYTKRKRCEQYGLTLEEYDSLIESQGGNCAICGRTLGEKWQTIDHDHSTGKVRGIVHRGCNLVIGNASEDIRVLVGAICYLLKHCGVRPPSSCPEDRRRTQ